MGKCKNCGKETFGNYEYCMNCKPKSNNPGSSGVYSTAGQRSSALPAECVFKDSFYEPDGFLKRAIFIEAAEKMAQELQRQDPPMTQTSLRQLFNMVKSIDMRLKADRKLPLGFIRESFFKFVVQTEYQTKRKVVCDLFRDFVIAHEDLATKDQKEFRGFAEYLTAILARMKMKK